MPKRDVDYSKTIVYKLVCNDTRITDLYVGSTTDFTRRKSEHKNVCNNENHKSNKLKIYECINNNGGWSNWSMILIENYPCNDGNEARARERFYYEQLNAKLNMIRPMRTRDECKEQMKERYDANKQQIQEQKKEHYEANRTQILEQKKEYYEANRTQILEQKKEHYEKNKEQILEQQKEYREKNKAKIKENRKKKYVCNCGSEITLYSNSRHEKSKKHIDFLSNALLPTEIDD